MSLPVDYGIIRAFPAGVAEWQTRRIQNPLPLKACGFKSHLRHIQGSLQFQQVQGSFIFQICYLTLIIQISIFK